ncbi:hypothetical protein JCM8547_003191 [Rhodosporidiobolus lusitaniae]
MRASTFFHFSSLVLPVIIAASIPSRPDEPAKLGQRDFGSADVTSFAGNVGEDVTSVFGEATSRVASVYDHVTSEIAGPSSTSSSAVASASNGTSVSTSTTNSAGGASMPLGWLVLTGAALAGAVITGC